MASENAGNINATSLRFEWEIDNDTIKSKNVGEYLESAKFTANFGNSSIQWRMHLYPKGVETYSGDYLSFILYYIDDDSKLRPLYFKIVNDKGENIAENEDVRPLSVRIKLSYLRAECISRNFVENPANGILRNNTLKFSFESTLESKKIVSNEATNQVVEDDVSPRLEEKYEALLTSGKFSDVSLISEGKTMKVHKCILAQNSPMFAAMFDAEMKEMQENIVEIPDTKYDVLVEMVRFIYTGMINNIGTLAGEVAVAADKYALDGLKNTCEKMMIKNLSHDNIIDYLGLAGELCMDKLKKKAIEFIVENANDVSDRPEFKLLSCDIVCEVFRCLAKKK